MAHDIDEQLTKQLSEADAIEAQERGTVDARRASVKSATIATVAVLALAGVLGLAGCGGGNLQPASSSGASTVSRPPSGSDPNQIRGLLTDVYTSTDTVLCQTDFTNSGRAAFESFSTGESCPQRMESNASRRSPGLVIHSLSVQGQKAIAAVTTKNGGTFSFEFVKQGGSWKISGIRR